MENRPHARTREEIRKELLKQAWERSEEEGRQMEAAIAAALERANTIPEEHLEILGTIDPTQPRGVLMLNALARANGDHVVYTKSDPHRKPTIH